jgi:hypothetical protein
MAGKLCYLLDRHATVGQQRDERVPQSAIFFAMVSTSMVICFLSEREIGRSDFSVRP